MWFFNVILVCYWFVIYVGENENLNLLGPKCCNIDQCSYRNSIKFCEVVSESTWRKFETGWIGKEESCEGGWNGEGKGNKSYKEECELAVNWYVAECELAVNWYVASIHGS